MSLLPQYQSAFGLYRVLLSSQDLSSHLGEIVEETKKLWPHLDSEIHDGGTHAERYRQVRLLDTFFSDSFPVAVLRELLQNAQRDGYQVRILLLDPLSRLAHSRATALRVDPLNEVNAGLELIRKAMGNIGGTVLRPRVIAGMDRMEYLERQLLYIHSAPDEYPVEVRFYNVLTESPFYIIHQYAAKGQIKHMTSAKENPWLLFVDDPRQDDDIYDFLLEGFDTIWNDPDACRLHPTGRENFEERSVFVAFQFDAPHSDSFWRAAENVCRQFGVRPVRGDSTRRNRPIDNVRSSIRTASAILADITENSPNVLLEVGLALEMGKHVLLVSRESPDEAPYFLRDFNITRYTLGGREEKKKGATPLPLALTDCLDSVPGFGSGRFGAVASLAKRSGLTFKHRPNLHAPVVSCREAVDARRIEDHEELKSLVLTTDNGSYAVVHTPFPKRVDLRRVKSALGVQQAHLASPDGIADDFLVRPGTVCPFIPSLWRLPNLVDESVLEIPLMYTNDGTLTGYLEFDPKILTKAPEFRQGRFVRGSSDLE